MLGTKQIAGQPGVHAVYTEDPFHESIFDTAFGPLSKSRSDPYARIQESPLSTTASSPQKDKNTFKKFHAY